MQSVDLRFDAVGPVNRPTLRHVAIRASSVLALERPAGIDMALLRLYSPSELRLLFMHTGFIVHDVYGDYRPRPPRTGVRELVMIARAS